MTNIEGMFAFSAFNNPLDSWDVSAVTSMQIMFFRATFFDQPLNGWNVSAATDMGLMFGEARAFNQPLGLWNVSKVTEMSFMFYDAVAFNQDITSWDTAAVKDMGYMFAAATAFNQPLGSWNVTSVRNMTEMFAGASSFNQTLCDWGYLLHPATNVSKMFGISPVNGEPAGCPLAEVDAVLTDTPPGPFCQECPIVLMEKDANETNPGNASVSAPRNESELVVFPGNESIST